MQQAFLDVLAFMRPAGQMGPQEPDLHMCRELGLRVSAREIGQRLVERSWQLGRHYPDSILALRIRLMMEELGELLSAIGTDDLVEVADGLADLVYVTLGTAVAFGIDLPAVWAQVHAANMAKLLPCSDCSGPNCPACSGLGVTAQLDKKKVMKPEGWAPPDIAGELDAQRASSLDERYPPGARGRRGVIDRHFKRCLVSLVDLCLQEATQAAPAEMATFIDALGGSRLMRAEAIAWVFKNPVRLDQVVSGLAEGPSHPDWQTMLAEMAVSMRQTPFLVQGLVDHAVAARLAHDPDFAAETEEPTRAPPGVSPEVDLGGTLWASLSAGQRREVLGQLDNTQLAELHQMAGELMNNASAAPAETPPKADLYPTRQIVWQIFEMEGGERIQVPVPRADLPRASRRALELHLGLGILLAQEDAFPEIDGANGLDVELSIDMYVQPPLTPAAVTALEALGWRNYRGQRWSYTPSDRTWQEQQDVKGKSESEG